MRNLDSGVMPVSENDRWVGMLTHRDLTGLRMRFASRNR
jgi:hypothetical protein